MLRIDKAILHGDHVEWLEEPPAQAHPVEVQIAFPEGSTSHREPNRGRARRGRPGHKPITATLPRKRRWYGPSN